jgi:hypothetical protein
MTFMQTITLSSVAAGVAGGFSSNASDPGLWPMIATIGLGAAAIAARRLGIGGSDANVLLSGDVERIMRLWREKRGEEPPEDLSGKLPVMMGCWTEAFNRQWYERQTGLAIADIGSDWTSITHPWRRATLDGFIECRGAVWEAKHTSAFVSPDEVLARYMPQLQHNMAVAGVETAILSVFYGNHKWESYDIAADWLYQTDLLEAEEMFWNCVRSGVEPVAVPPPPPPKPIGYRELSLEGSNAWASAAADWSQHGEAARLFTAAAKSLKELIPGDVSRAFGHGIEARRSKSGALSIRELTQ